MAYISLIIPILLIILSIMLKSHIDQYIHAKVNKLHDRTDFFSSYYALCSFVTLRDDCESQLAAFNIRKVIPELEGQNVKYIGKSLSLAWPSLQVQLNKDSYVIVTTFRDVKSAAELSNRLTNSKCILQHFSQIGYHPFLGNFFISNLLFALRIKQTIFAEFAKDLSISAIVPNRSEAVIFGDYVVSNLLRESNLTSIDSPMYIWNWLKDSKDSQMKQHFDEYGLTMMSMLSQFGGGLLNKFDVVPSSTNSGTFDTVASVYYPSKSFLIQLISSSWMYGVVAGKELEDSIALITVGLPLD